MENGARTSPRPLLDEQAAISELVRTALGEQPLDDILRKAATLARNAIPGVDQVSVTLIKNDQAYTAVFTGKAALRLDERQYDAGYGPCMDAAVTGATIVIDDTSTDRRYPEFNGLAARTGIRRTMSVGLPVPSGSVGALNLYGAGETSFDDAAMKAAQTFAGYAAVVLANAALYADAREMARQMQQAMESRTVIDQAKGILMRDNRCTAEEAFTILVTASNRSNRKLREIAAVIVEATQRGS